MQRVDGRNPLRYVLPIGQMLPLHVGMGKVLGGGDARKRTTSHAGQGGDIRLATGERVTRKGFLAELDRIRRQGYVISRNERRMGAAFVGVPVVDASGTTIAAVAVAGPTDRLTMKKLEQLSIRGKRALARRSPKDMSAAHGDVNSSGRTAKKSELPFGIINLKMVAAKQPGARQFPTVVNRAAGLALTEVLPQELAGVQYPGQRSCGR